MPFLSPRWPIFAFFAKVGLFPSAGLHTQTRPHGRRQKNIIRALWLRVGVAGAVPFVSKGTVFSQLQTLCGTTTGRVTFSHFAILALNGLAFVLPALQTTLPSLSRS